MGFDSVSCFSGFGYEARHFMLSLSFSSCRRQMAMAESPMKAINRLMCFATCTASRISFNMSWLAHSCGVGKVGNSLEALMW